MPKKFSKCITADRLYIWETGKTLLPPDIEQAIENIEKKLNKREALTDIELFNSAGFEEQSIATIKNGTFILSSNSNSRKNAVK